MTNYFDSHRYGDLDFIAAKSDGACHLCHQPADLTFYGRTGAFGDDTTNIDHLVPQAHGGDDHPSNLMVAHGVCNAIRGTRDVEETRLELAGTRRAPRSRAEKNALSLGAGAGLAITAGYMLSRPQPDGSGAFNGEAAALVGLATFALARCLL